MATSGTTVINDVLKRMRDEQAAGNSTVQPPTTASGRAFVLTLINHALIFLCLGERLATSTSDLILSPNTVLYDLTQVLTPSDYGGRVVSCNVAGSREIDGPVDYKALGRASRTWLTDVDKSGLLTAPIAWAPIGCTLLALTPGLAPFTTVTIRYIQAPPFLTVESNTLNMSDYAAGHLARLVSLLDSIKLQQLTDFQNRLQAFAQDMGALATNRMTGGKAD